MATTTCKECNQTGLIWSTHWPDGGGPALLNPDGSLHYRRGSAQVSCPARANRPTGPLVESKAYSLSASFNPDKERQLTEMVTNANDNVRTALSAVGGIGMRMDGLTATVGASLAANKASIDAALTKLDEARRIELVIKRPNLDDLVIKNRQHPLFGRLIVMASTGKPVFLRGPAGSGKTTAVENLAAALGVPFYRMGINAQTTKTDLFGFQNMMNGKYSPSIAYEATGKPSVLMFDEFDRGMPGMSVMINTLADDASVTWPNGETRKRHPKCVIIAAGNTFGRGADALYTSANQLDAAALDRFGYIDWDYDWDLTHEIVGLPEWSRKVQAWSEAAAELKLKVVIGPRAALNGADYIRAGMSHEEAAEATIWAPVGADHKRTIMAKVKDMMLVETTWVQAQRDEDIRRYKDLLAPRGGRW